MIKVKKQANKKVIGKIYFVFDIINRLFNEILIFGIYLLMKYKT